MHEGALWTELSADALCAIHALMMSPATSFQELDPRRAEALAALHRTASRARQGRLSRGAGLHRRFHSDPVSAAVMRVARGDDCSAGGGESERPCEPLGEGSANVVPGARQSQPQPPRCARRPRGSRLGPAGSKSLTDISRALHTARAHAL